MASARARLLVGILVLAFVIPIVSLAVFAKPKPPPAPVGDPEISCRYEGGKGKDKGIAKITYQSKSGPNRLTLDDWKYETDPTRAILLEVFRPGGAGPTPYPLTSITFGRTLTATREV